MSNRLFVDELVSVGLVPSGDNPEAEVLIYKAHPESQVEVVKLSDQKNSAESASTTREVIMDLSAIEDQTLRKAIEGKFAEMQGQIDELTPSDDVVKAESDEVQELIAKQQEELQRVSKDLADERAARRTTEFIAKAEPLQGLLGKPEDVGPVLADLSDKAPDSYEKLESWLTAASQREDMAKLFSTMGAGEGEGESDPIAKRESWVKANRQEGETEAQTRARYWTEHPEAVEESRS